MRSKYLLVALLAGVPLGALTVAILADDDGLALASATGLATGLVTGCIAGGYVAWRDRAWSRWAAKVRARHEADGVVHDGPGAVGEALGAAVAVALVGAPRLLARRTDGWLLLTKHQLVFEPRGLSGKPIQIALADIAGARRGDGLLPNTIALRTRSNTSIEIRVQKRDEWLDQLARVPGITVIR
jgi:hypothetical protein